MLNQIELGALYGLPREAQLLYCVGIRPHMNYTDGMVGTKRKISLKGLCESLYVEPHQGRKNTGEPKINQVRTWLKNLRDAGLITAHSEVSPQCKKLLVKCELATLKSEFVQAEKPSKPQETKRKETGPVEEQPKLFDEQPVKKPRQVPSEADIQTVERILEVKRAAQSHVRTPDIQEWAGKIMELREKVRLPNLENAGQHPITHDEIVLAFEFAYWKQPFWSDKGIVVSPSSLYDQITRKRKATFRNAFIDWLEKGATHVRTPKNTKPQPKLNRTDPVIQAFENMGFDLSNESSAQGIS